MKVQDFCKQILKGGDIEDKLINIEKLEFDDFSLGEMPILPERNKKISFSEEQIKFPKKNTLNLDEKKAIALNSFANHELLAIEMMACALVIFPHTTEEQKRMKKGILSALKDEQKHFKMYSSRMNQLGYQFGDFPLNDFFWRQMSKLDSPEKFFAVMSLTFEAANLDFALYYHDIFKEFEDHQTASILKVVFEDEVSHVALGVNYLNKWKEDKTLWEYYLKILPFPMTPDRSKGIIFSESARKSAGLDLEFVEKVKNYQDEFKVTKRKSWNE